MNYVWVGLLCYVAGWITVFIKSEREIKILKQAFAKEFKRFRQEIQQANEHHKDVTRRYQSALDLMRARKDQAYLERNRVVAVLAKLFPSGRGKTDIPGWSEDWHQCVYIDLPVGQASWHYQDDQAFLFSDLPLYKGTYDGHTTEDKYKRLELMPIPTEIVTTHGSDGTLFYGLRYNQEQFYK